MYSCVWRYFASSTFVYGIVLVSPRFMLQCYILFVYILKVSIYLNKKRQKYINVHRKKIKKH